MATQRLKGVRLAIATVLNGRWRTLYQTAAVLGRHSGDIQKPLRQMLGEGMVETEVPGEPEPGTRFRLVESYEEALAEALRADQIPGLVESNQDLFLLTAPSQEALDLTFAKGDLAATVSWAARLGSRTQMLLAVAPNASEEDFRRLSRELESAHIKIDSYRTASVLDGRRLRATSKGSTKAVSMTVGKEA
jgi:hypothetical protein